ncbi:MAG: GH36 C-terminal domain-containing protein, partial [Gammaproteobacteria bacterium]|nr:GH36 C-terminal domain-containing protein [Gammaproteobacteria bacterium]
LSNRRAFYDASYLLPPAMLESYVAEWPAARLENLRYLLRSGMLGWFSLMLDPARWSAAQRAAAQSEFDFYKRILRPLIRDADLYHVSERPDGVHWDGVEYITRGSERGVLYAFRGSGDSGSHRFVLRGLHPGRTYRVQFRDHSAHDTHLTGRTLLSQGLKVTLMSPVSSELVSFEQIAH